MVGNSKSNTNRSLKKLSDIDWTQKTQAISSLLLLILSLITLPLITRQVYLGNRSVTSGSQSTIYEQSHEILLYLSEDPRLYDYFYNSKEVENSIDSILLVKIKIATLMYGDLFEHIALCFDDMDNKTSEGWIVWINDVYKSSPPLQKLFEERREWYSPSLLSKVTLIKPAPKDPLRKEYFFMLNHKN